MEKIISILLLVFHMIVVAAKEMGKDCTDISRYCKHAKEMGECKSSINYVKSFMEKNCKQTCGLCAIKKAACKDKHTSEHCDKFKSLGFCDNIKYRRHITTYCKKTCELCDVTKTYKCGVAKARKTNSTKSIVFGETAKKGAWPWQVAIYKNGRIICGGTLVSNRYVISAAHCFRQIVPRNYSIVLGEHNRKANEGTEQRVNVKRIVRHEDWREDGPHDIAVVELGATAIFTKYITPACLPRADEEVPVGTKCFMSGWGKLGAGRDSALALQQAPLKIVSHQDCLKKNRNYRRKVTPTMICADDKEKIFTSGCHGDSGGPFVCENEAGHMVLQGAVSWGSPVCDAMDHYTVFTKVSKYREWIDKAMNN